MMELAVKSINTINKEVYLDGRKLDVLDFGEISRTNRIGSNCKISEVNFIPRVATDEILLEYGITEETYKKITKYLEKEIKSILY